jgi:hypothetical protein
MARKLRNQPKAQSEDFVLICASALVIVAILEL